MDDEQLTELASALTEAAQSGEVNMPRTITPPQLDPSERQALTPAEMSGQEWRRRCDQAALFVATCAEDADDCHMLLDMLGLLGDDTQPYRGDAMPLDCSPHVGDKWR